MTSLGRGARAVSAIRSAPAFFSCVLLSAVPVAVAVWFVQGFSLTVPLFDHWTLLPVYARFASGHPRISDFALPHNGLHVALFARLFLAILATATHWSFRAEIYAGLAFAAYTVWILDRAFTESIEDSSRSPCRGVVLALTTALAFSPAQDWIWTWSIGFFHYFENACIATTVYAVATKKPRLMLAAGACLVATFNRFEGLFSWLAFAPAVVVAVRRAPSPKRALWAFIATGAMTVAAIVVLLAVAPPAEIAASGGSAMPLNVVAALRIGASLVGMAPGLVSESRGEGMTGSPYVVSGLVVIASFAALALAAARGARTRVAAEPWIGLGVFGLVFAFATALARSETLRLQAIGLSHWYQSSYSVTASLVAIATAHLGGILHAHARPATRSSRAFAVASAFAVLVLAADTLHAAPRLAGRRLDGHWDRHCLELARYLAPENACFVPLAGARTMEMAGFARLRGDVAFDRDADAVAGHVYGVRVLPKTAWSPPALAVLGTANIPDDSAGTVLAAFPGEFGFFALASRFERTESGTRFTLLVPRAAVRPGKTAILLRVYDARAARFYRIEGDVDASALLAE